MARRLALLCALGCALLPTASARAADLPEGSEWTQATIMSGDGTPLHADILRPEGLSDTDKTPVILSVGPYFNHSGEVGPIGPLEQADYDPFGPVDAPSSRFYDFVDGARLMDKGYSFVMVDLRGFGGSGGCLDWGGPGEQGDVKAAVEWAASQPWSTGNVGMYGKSYDGVTGLVGEVSEPAGLTAVVSMEPVYDLYRYLYSEGVRYENSLATPALYDAIAVTPGPLADDVTYNINAFNTPDCLAQNIVTQQDADHQSDFWKQRTLIEQAKGKTIPLFLTQGFLENNTKPDGSFDFFNNLAGAHNRAWFGMWDHVRGNQVDEDDRLVEGRAGFFDEVMRFFDRHVKGDTAADPDADPKIVVQTSDGTWRGERSWPPADSMQLTSDLNPGAYDGDGQNEGTGSGAGNGIWTFSPPLAHDAWYAGVPKVDLELSVSGLDPHVAVDTYDVDPGGSAILLSRNASLVPADGKLSMDLYGNDWKLPAGHRLAVLVTDVNAEWWLPADPESIELLSGTISLPFLTYDRPETIQGDPAVRLQEWLADAPFDIDPDTIAGSESAAFKLPAALIEPGAAATPTPAPEGQPTPAPAPGSPTTTSTSPTVTGQSLAPAQDRLRVRIVRRRGHRIRVFGRAPVGSRLTIRLRLRGRTVKVRRIVTGRAHYRVTFKGVPRGRFRAAVVARKGDTVLRGRSRRARPR